MNSPKRRQPAPDQENRLRQQKSDSRILRGRSWSATAAVVGLDPQNRTRRTKSEIAQLCDALYEIVAEHQPVTVRQAYYLAVSAGIIDKTEAAYKGVVCRLLAKMRRADRLPYEWIVDSTRWQRKPRSYSDLESALAQTAQFYRRNFWERMNAYVEVWCEKDALAGVLYEVTSQWDVPLMVSRGFASHTYLYEAAEAIKATGKPVFLYYFGDHDPSGVHIDRSIERELRRFAPETEIHFERVAVTPEQISALKLPTRPTKMSDGRSKSFEGRSVEVDAIPPATLKQIVEVCIVRHIDHDELARLRTVEAAEKDTLKKLGAIGFEDITKFTDSFRYAWDEGTADE